MAGLRRFTSIASGAAGLALATIPAAQAEVLGFGAGYDSYGAPGMIDMPIALSRPDAELAFSASHFRNQSRLALGFQITPRLSATLRYARLAHVGFMPDGIYYDRSLSLHYRLLDEGTYRPALALGLNDIVGTGYYGGEYVVATKHLAPNLRVSAGLGWGRLGSSHGFDNPLSALFGDSFNTRPPRTSDPGGSFQPDQWFHGDAALFGGVEWQANDRLSLVAEYSSDAYLDENGHAFDRRSPFNFGVNYQIGPQTTLAARYMYGSELGLQVTYALNPKLSRSGSGYDTAPPPVVRAADLAPLAADSVEGNTRQALAQEGLRLTGLQVQGHLAVVRLENSRYGQTTQALGRAARVLTRNLPAEVSTFEVVFVSNGMAVSKVTLQRNDLESLEFSVDAPRLLAERSSVADAWGTALPSLANSYPRWTGGFAPYLKPSLFDPENPLRADLGLGYKGQYEVMPGLVISGQIQQKLIGNLSDYTRESNSTLPHVRSDANHYYAEGSTALTDLTLAYYFRAGPDLFGRVTAGYLEPMFGGVSTELLWKPVAQRWALGAEINYALQRDFDQMLGFSGYTVATGHLSGYYDFGGGLHGQLDVGRYLAGDYGATLSLDREFGNGWRIGAYATLTDVSAEEFGEGSFDKGIRLTIPLAWITGRPSQKASDLLLRPVQRDGGARLEVQGRLYDQVRRMQAAEISDNWGRFWK